MFLFKNFSSPNWVVFATNLFNNNPYYLNTSDSLLDWQGSPITNPLGFYIRNGTILATYPSSITVPITIDIAGTISTSSYTNLTLTSVVSGPGNLTVGGLGQLNLNNTNTYTGTTTIVNGSQLSLIDNGSIANSSGVINNGIFNISGAYGNISIASLVGSSTGAIDLGANSLNITNASGMYQGAINGTGGLNLNGGNQIFSGDSGYTGGTFISNNSTLTLLTSTGIGPGNISLNDGTLVMGGNSQTYIMPSFMNLSVSGSANTIQIDPTNTTIITKNRLGSGLLNYVNNGTIQFNSPNDITLSDPISGIGGLAQMGSGTLTLASSITLTANSFLNAGMNQGVIEGQPTANNLILNGVISDGGNGYGLVISGVGNVTFSNINSYSGLTTINGGNLFLTGLGSIAASSGLVNNGSFDISGTYAGAIVKSYSGSGILILGNQLLTITSPALTETMISIATTNVLTQIMATSKVIPPPPVAAPITGTEVVSNSTDSFTAKTSSSSSPTSTQTNTPSTTVSETTAVTTNVQSQTLVGAEFQAPAVNVTTTSNTQTSTRAPVTAATTSSGSTVTKVAPASQAAPSTSPVIVSKPVPTDSADSGDKTLALVKPPVEASEPPKQPTRNDVRVTTTTVVSGVAIQKVDPIKPSSTEFYNQVISGLWNAK